MEEPEEKADVYAASERNAMVYWQNLRERALAPLLRGLGALGVSADHLTLFSLLAGLAFCPLYFFFPPWAFAALLVHVAVDGLDGPLARHLGRASRRGWFTDTMADQLVITATTVTLIFVGVFDVVAGSAYIFFYGIVVGFSMVRNALAIPYSWVVRPRFIVYIWLIVEAYLWPGTIGAVLWILVGLLAWKVLTGFVKIRRRI